MMIRMMIRKADGYVAVDTRSGSRYLVAPDQYTHVRDRWLRGEAFVETIGLYGEPMAFKLACVECVTMAHADAIAANEADDAEARKDDILRGD